MNEILQKKLKLFENHVCRTCAFTGQIKYYNIIDNFITYQTVHVPFTEIIRFVLDIEVCLFNYLLDSTFFMLDLFILDS